MADISVEKKKSGKSGELTWLWAGLAILSVVGLMVWLFSTQETTTQVITAAADAAPAATGEPAELSAVAGAPEGYVGRQVLLTDVPVAAVLGDRGFWADVPGANPFLVILGPAIADVAWLSPGETPTVEGTVQPVTEADVNRWAEDGLIRPEARDEASFALHYLDASRVER